MSNPKWKAMAAELGARGGRKGGKSTSPAKVAAVRKNIAKARKIKIDNLNKAV